MIFGIGLPKSGTRSLSQALNMLGYVGSHHDHDWRHDLMKLHPKRTHDKKRYIVLPEPQAAGALKDVLPDAKFICTVRNLDEWLNSATNNWRPRTPASSRNKPKSILRDLGWHEFLGTLDPSSALLEDVWYGWHARVDEWFKDSPARLLKINVCDGEGWEPLCKFLNHAPMPSKPFPFVGKAKKS